MYETSLHTDDNIHRYVLSNTAASSCNMDTCMEHVRLPYKEIIHEVEVIHKSDTTVIESEGKNRGGGWGRESQQGDVCTLDNW